MQRLPLTLGVQALRTSPPTFRLRPSTPTLSFLRTATTSAPTSAEGPSAESGGSRSKSASEAASTVPDALADGDVRGRTGGGEPLEASANAPPKPKILNQAVTDRNNLTEEQQAEVDEHNRDFESKHDRAERAEQDKVDKKFWRGGGTKE